MHFDPRIPTVGISSEDLLKVSMIKEVSWNIACSGNELKIS